MGYGLNLRRRLELGRKMSMDEFVGVLDRAVRGFGGSLEKNERVTMEEKIYGTSSLSATVTQQRVARPLVKLPFSDFFAKAKFDVPPRRSKYICMEFVNINKGVTESLDGNAQYEAVSIRVWIVMEIMPRAWQQWVYGLGIPLVGWIALAAMISPTYHYLNFSVSELPSDAQEKAENLMCAYIKAVVQELECPSSLSPTKSA